MEVGDTAGDQNLDEDTTFGLARLDTPRIRDLIESVFCRSRDNCLSAIEEK